MAKLSVKWDGGKKRVKRKPSKVLEEKAVEVGEGEEVVREVQGE